MPTVDKDRFVKERSRILRRSGIAVGLIMDLLEWSPDTCVQVGVGLHCQEVDVLKVGWPDLKFFGFEPHPRIYEGLKDTYPGELEWAAVSNESGAAILHSKKRHKDGSSLHPHYERDDEKYEQIEVPVTTLDEWNDETAWFDTQVMLWLDCEGNELKVLQGAENFIQSVQLVNVELTGIPPGDGWCDCWDVDRWLQDHGFVHQWIHTQRSSAGQRDAIYVRPHMFKPEHACCRCQVERWQEMQCNTPS